jgi:EAL domain-containing protein (putative c-di-GMP-specific phosphodiesterase class I)/CHASE2 domain-containing sensor protein
MRSALLRRIFAQVPKSPKQVSEPSPWKLLLWTAVAGLVFGLIGFGEIAEDWLRVGRNSLHEHKASGEIVVVRIDDEALRQYGSWPWSRRVHAQLIDRLRQAGVQAAYFDIAFPYRTDARSDAMLADSLKRSGKVTLATRSVNTGGRRIDSRPLPLFARYSKEAWIPIAYNYQNAAWRLPYGTAIQGKDIPSLSAAVAGISGPPGADYPVDYSVQFSSIPSVSAADVLDGKVGASTLRGKKVLVGADADIIGDRFFVPGYGRTGGVYVHAIGAETLKNGIPVDLGWFIPFLIALTTAALALLRERFLHRSLILGTSTVAVLCLPIMLEARLIFVDITPALFVQVTVITVLAWRRYRLRGFIDPVSSLPNLSAFRANREGRKQALIAARVMNYDEIVASLPQGTERRLVEQIVARLSVGAPNRTLYQGDGGIFAWFEDPKKPLGNHLEALYALFRNPAKVADLSIDLTIAFGVEVGSGRSLASRLASALVAAEEAAHDGLKWKYHEPETLEDASWKLSILSQLDSAIDKGEVWVAYQPKLELSTRRIVGAEALARWTHPEKGPIAATEFVAAAEQHNRIGKLTDFVLEKAVAAAAQINQRSDFDIAVNLSARLLSDKGFTLRLAALLARHGLDPSKLTLELTETAALAGSGEGFDMIARLRELGVRISIDDYGTGLSTLEYLKKVPANEIKIDQSFVKGIVDNRSDRLMVQSTIGLAHSLDRKVVAEGVEHHDTLQVLIDLGCDIAQGYAIGRPMSLESLTKRIAVDRKRSAA